MAKYNLALGAFLGAAVGDAAGAPLEFFKDTIDSDAIDFALSMSGGGRLRIGPGQITDDTELALCLANTLVAAKSKYGMPIDNIKQSYWEWLQTNPFDVGVTCSRAFKDFNSIPDYESKSNGALMRATPIAIYAHSLPAELIAGYARADACISHPNKTCQDANAAYCVAIAHLINNVGDSEGALRAARSVLVQSKNEDVLHWFDTVTTNDCEFPYDCRNSIGFVKWGFTLAFYHLKNRTPYEDCLRHVLSHGGDTDTNACIAGGLMGALHGAMAIPKRLSQPVLTYQWNEDDRCGYDRPRYLSASCIPDLVANML